MNTTCKSIINTLLQTAENIALIFSAVFVFYILGCAFAYAMMVLFIGVDVPLFATPSTSVYLGGFAILILLLDGIVFYLKHREKAA